MSLVFAGLVFEYVDLKDALESIDRCMAPGAVLVAVLQLPSDVSAPVTKTKYKSLNQLAPIMRLVPPEDFSNACMRLGLRPLKTRTIPLQHGKAFHVGHYQKVGGTDR